ncbi:MAG: TatD family hydrolase [Actinomycetota bacterium]|nr:TatD family hydrolase [Actinomycetota bacterium]
MWFDSHCHLYDLEDQETWDAVMERARAASVRGVLVVGVDPETSRRALELATASDMIWAGAAFHPSSSKGWQDAWLDSIEGLLANERVVAVGETGLDFYHDTSFVHDQRRMFAAHIELAKKRDKALVIHTRRSVDQALEMLQEHGPPHRLVFHCWSGDIQQLHRALGLGAFISFAGNVSFKNATDLRAAARAVPVDRLVVETDAPYLAPVPHRGKRNEPAYVRFVGEAVAAARGATPIELAEVTTSNARRLFAL